MKKLLFALMAAALVFSGCNKMETTATFPQSPTGGPGPISVKITDDPFNISMVESATITISKVEMRKAGTADSGSYIDLQINPVTIDVFKLRNGVTEELANLVIPKGDYDLVRLIVDEANLKLKGNSEVFNMKVPSGSQTGIKVFISPAIHVEGGISAELILDFNLAKSFVMRGHDAKNGFIFKPVIRATNSSTAGRVEGVVTDDSPAKAGVENAIVSLKKEADTTAAVTALTDSTGHYVFIGVPAGTYSLSVTKDNFVSDSISGVVVVAGNQVTVNFILKGFPVYVSSVIENSAPSILVMTYSKALADTVPDVSAFTVKVNTLAKTVSSVAVSGTNVSLTLSSPVVKNDTVTVAYTMPLTKALQTAEGLKAASFTAKNVTNNVN